MFSRIARLKRGGWMGAGIVVGLIIAPGAALAAFTDVRIVGPFGNPPTAVTAANQLRVAEIDPANVRIYRLTSGGNACMSVDAPAGSSLMLKQAVVDVFFNPTPSAFDGVQIFNSKNCPIGSVVAETSPQGERDTLVVPFDPGIPIPSGNGFSVKAAGSSISADVHLLAYTMPPGAVPVNVPVVTKGVSKAKAARR